MRGGSKGGKWGGGGGDSWASSAPPPPRQPPPHQPPPPPQDSAGVARIEAQCGELLTFVRQQLRDELVGVVKNEAERVLQGTRKEVDGLRTQVAALAAEVSAMKTLLQGEVRQLVELVAAPEPGGAPPQALAQAPPMDVEEDYIPITSRMPAAAAAPEASYTSWPAAPVEAAEDFSHDAMPPPAAGVPQPQPVRVQPTPRQKPVPLQRSAAQPAAPRVGGDPPILPDQEQRDPRDDAHARWRPRPHQAAGDEKDRHQMASKAGNGIYKSGGKGNGKHGPKHARGKGVKGGSGKWA